MLGTVASTRMTVGRYRRKSMPCKTFRSQPSTSIFRKSIVRFPPYRSSLVQRQNIDGPLDDFLVTGDFPLEDRRIEGRQLADRKLEKAAFAGRRASPTVQIEVSQSFSNKPFMSVWMRFDIDSAPAEIVELLRDAATHRVSCTHIDIESVLATAKHAIEQHILKILRVTNHVGFGMGRANDCR